MPHVQIILASTREGRMGDKVAAWVMSRAKKRKEFAAELVDLRDWPLPHQVVNELHMVSVHDEVNMPFVTKVFDAGDAFLQEEIHGPKLEKLFVELADKLQQKS